MSNVQATLNTKLSSVAYHPSPIDFQEANSKAATLSHSIFD